MVQGKSSSVNDTGSLYDEVWELSPVLLQESCLDTIVDNLQKLTSHDVHACGNGDMQKVQGLVGHPFIPDKMAEKLLHHLSVRSCITNDTLSIFHSGQDFNLKVVRLPEINLNTAGSGLQGFSKFSLKEIELGCTAATNRWSMKRLIDSFSGSFSSLQVLKLNLFPAVSVTAGTIVDFASKFPNLTTLCYTTPVMGNAKTFTISKWEQLLCSCPNLQVLSIHFNGSCQTLEIDSQVFAKHGKNLRTLMLHSALNSVWAVQYVSCIIGFVSMDQLSVLDLSVDVEPQDIYNVDTQLTELQVHHHCLASQVTKFLEAARSSMKSLKSLDISGIVLVEDPAIESFLISHPKLDFLGLCMLNSKYCLNSSIADVMKHMEISGTVIERQIISALQRYPNRAKYLKEAFKGLFQVSFSWEKRRPHVLQLILDAMMRYKGYLQLQMAATACIFNLTKDRDSATKDAKDLHVVLLSRVATITTSVLILYMGNIQMVKNCLLIICTDRILHQAKFDRVAVSRLCLDCMLKYREEVDRHVTRMAVAIVSILACKISSTDTTALMQDKEMRLLLDIVQRRLDEKINDGTLKFDLSALWNLTDESPQACQLFVEQDGLIIYRNLLEAFPDEEHIQTKVLGLLNNIAEVPALHTVMLRCIDLMNFVRRLIRSEQVQVSYFACGIIANLALRWDGALSIYSEEDKQIMLTEVTCAVDRWGALKSEIVTYRSFKPFYGLLECMGKPEIQRWAVWAIHHVCTLAADHYRGLMMDECLRMLDVIHRSTRNAFTKMQCEQIFDICQKWPLRRHTSI